MLNRLLSQPVARFNEERETVKRETDSGVKVLNAKEVLKQVDQEKEIMYWQVKYLYNAPKLFLGQIPVVHNQVLSCGTNGAGLCTKSHTSLHLVSRGWQTNHVRWLGPKTWLPLQLITPFKRATSQWIIPTLVLWAQGQSVKFPFHTRGCHPHWHSLLVCMCKLYKH